MGATDFEFGHNVRDNADPWGRNTGPDDRVRSAHSEPSDSGPVSELVEITCGQVLKMVRQMTATVRKANRESMALKKPTGNATPANGSGRAKPPERKEGSGDFLPWLKIGDLLAAGLKPGSKFKITISEARELPAGNVSDVVLDVKIPKVGKFKGGSYAWGLSAEKQQYAALYEKFGDRLDRWKGSVTCTLKEPSKKGFNPSLQVL